MENLILDAQNIDAVVQALEGLAIPLWILVAERVFSYVRFKGKHS